MVMQFKVGFDFIYLSCRNLSKHLVVYSNSFDELKSSIRSCLVCHQTIMSQYFNDFDSINQNQSFPILMCLDQSFVQSFFSNANQLKMVWLISLKLTLNYCSSNSSSIMIYAFGHQQTDTSRNHLFGTCVYQLPFYQAPIVSWSMLHHPVQIDCNKSFSISSFEKSSVNDVLIMLTEIGEGICIFHSKNK